MNSSASRNSDQMRALGSRPRLEILNAHIATVFERVGYEDDRHRCRYSDVRDVVRKGLHPHVAHAADAS